MGVQVFFRYQIILESILKYRYWTNSILFAIIITQGEYSSPAGGEKMIILEHVDKSFTIQKRKVHAVNDVSLHIRKGEIYGIIGFSGAGKSTLVRCINQLEKPEKGTVLVDGEDITKLRGARLRQKRRKIGMIFQHFNLFASRTVFQNVAYPLRYQGWKKADIEKKVSELLELVDIAEKRDAYPSQLSGGQKQRVAIARALANDPQILLCDEATSALDPQTTLAILRLLRKINQTLGITIVIITHEMNVIKEVCDNVAVMENGKVAEHGDVFTSTPREPVTKRFIETTSNLSKVHTLLEDHSPLTQIKDGQKIVRLKYLSPGISEALISELAVICHVTANIIFANVDLIGDHPLGGLVAILSGTENDMQNAFDYLQKKHIGVEVIQDAGSVNAMVS